MKLCGWRSREARVICGRPLPVGNGLPWSRRGPGSSVYSRSVQPSGRDPLATVTVTVQRSVELFVVEQRYRAVLAVERGEPKIVVVAQFRIFS